MEFPEILRALRLQSGFTQKQLGEKLELKISTVCDWEKRLSEPNLRQLKTLGEIFGVSVDFLLGCADEC